MKKTKLLSVFLAVILTVGWGILSAVGTAAADTDTGFVTAVTHQKSVPSGYTGIYTIADLDKVRANMNGKYILMNDIDACYMEVAPIGVSDFAGDPTDGEVFTGVFDGNGYTIANIDMNVTGAKKTCYVGLFTAVKGEVKNLAVSGAVMATQGASSTLRVGGVAGYVYPKGKVTNCLNRADVTGSGAAIAVGGIAGESAGKIVSCRNAGGIIGGYSGGIVGWGAGGTVADCSNVAEVSAARTDDTSAGGIIAQMYGGIVVDHCYNTGAVTANTTNGRNEKKQGAGGIAAVLTSGTVTSCWNSGAISSQAYWSGYNGDCAARAGGIAAYAGESVSSGKIDSCWNSGAVLAFTHCNKADAYSNRNYVYSYAGGVVGEDRLSITNVYNTGLVTTTIKTTGYTYNTNYTYLCSGGIVGMTYPQKTETLSIKNAYNTGKLEWSWENGSNQRNSHGMIIGHIDNGGGGCTLTNCYWSSEDTSVVAIGGNADTAVQTRVKALTANEMKQQSSFTGFPFGYTWQMGATRPELIIGAYVPTDEPCTHDNLSAWIKEVPATCTTDGVKGHYHCPDCEKDLDDAKKELSSLAIPKAGHSYGTWIAEVAPTCQKTGTLGHYHCSACGKDFDESKHELSSLTLGKVAHSFSIYVFNNNATCSADGTETATCIYGCGTKDTRTKAGTKTDHNYGTLIPETPASCSGSGMKAHYECSSCHKLFDTGKNETTSAALTISASHSYGAWIAEVAATCEKTGTKGHYHCSGCGKDFDESKQALASLTIPALGHNYVTYTYNNDATCLKNGTETAKCTRCTATNTREKAGTKVQHQFDTYKYNNDATCTKDGTETATCKFGCGTKDTRTKTGSKLGHNYGSLIPEAAASCSKSGMKAHYECSRCHLLFDANKVQSSSAGLTIAPSHNYGTWIPEVAATCAKQGVKGHYHCSVCGKDFDNNKKQLDSLTLPLISHSFGAYIYNNDATCSKNGTETRKCTRCGITSTREKTGSKLEHEYGTAWQSDSTGHWRVCKHCSGKSSVMIHTAGAPATEKSPQVCTVCGFVIKAALGHKHTLTPVAKQDPTCTRDGHVPYYVCSGCSLWFSDAEGKNEIKDHSSVVIPSPGHHAMTDEAVEPTCTKDGKTEGSHCSVCGLVIIRQDTIPATGHTPVDDSAVAPTCTENGKTAGSHCSVCGEILAKQETVPASGHTGGALECDEKGHWKTCSICGEKIDYEKHIAGEGTSKDDAKTCKVCGYVMKATLGDNMTIIILGIVAAAIIIGAIIISVTIVSSKKSKKES